MGYKITNRTFNQLIGDIVRCLIVLLTASAVVKIYFSIQNQNQIQSYRNSEIGSTYNNSPPDKSHSQLKADGDITYNKIYGNVFLPSVSDKKGKKYANTTKITQLGTKAGKSIAIVPDVYIFQGYPSSQKYNYREIINLSIGNNAVMTLKKEEQPMWFGIGNADNFNIANPSLYLNFDGSFDITIKGQESVGWVETDPDRSYYVKVSREIQPGTGVRLYPLFVKFPQASIYKVNYSIASDNNLPNSGSFNISVAE